MLRFQGLLPVVACWALIGIFYVFEHPLIRSVGERLVPLALLFLTAITTAGCGSWALAGSRRFSRRPLEFLCLTSALGWSILSTVLCSLAAFHQFTPIVLVTICIGCSIEFGIRRHNSGWQIWTAVPWWKLTHLYQRRWATLVAGFATLLVIGVTALWAMGPVWDYDSEMYHLPNSARLLENQGLVISREEPLANLPGQAYLWFALGLACHAEAYPALLVCWSTVMTSFLAASLASRWLGIRVGLWTVPVFWSGLIVHAVASTPRIEPIYSFLFLAVVTWLLETSLTRQLSWAVVFFCGMCLGNSAAIKAQGLYAWPVIGIWWLWQILRHRHWRHVGVVFQITCMFLVGFAVLIPWWTKNYLAFGNPVHPMLSRVLDPENIRNGNSYGPTNQTRPWYFWVRDTAELFLRPDTFSGPPGQWPHYLFLIIPLLLLVWLAAFHSRQSHSGEVPPAVRTSRILATLCLLTGGYYLLSLSLTHELRHQFGMFSLASVLAATVITQFTLRSRLKLFLPGGVSLLLMFVALFPPRVARFPDLARYLVGLLNSRQMHDLVVPGSYLRAIDWCHGNMPEQAVILLCWESRTYRLKRAAIADPGAFTWRTLFRGRSSAREVAAYLRQQRIDYVLVNEAAMVYNVKESRRISRSLYDEFQQQRERLVPDVLEPVFRSPSQSSSSIVIYRVRTLDQ